ncbi:MAG: L-threonine 3-dehydrogenase [Bacteroidetes bacterium GWC2_33_15]|nr:MAG: L-threonine 3-dehydrogenase [Bacteroidetes bacterium GWA2_33_15]OFX49429.1 MAG: L-threonine 3-dehydrogenase [Bacteroidetes bacterium GWC2_33_15]OFX63079.1 MAG: L-threonine 3-dehydrogenase [Bacteroidetes bacterium GWB2_32_14]OFX68777.1 MAG: L-threonine 3-dehydrogenase [Bacteroidetes bacterium GWD2_33_33]HAN19101.1 L-threonine 3-dehydrogenase [Bacteroidales bacterium]
MKALVKSKPERGLWMEEVEIPKVGINDILIKVKKSAICGTDLHIYRWDEWSQKTIKIGQTIGHEYVGTVAEMGAGVTGFKIGERVTGEGHIACGQCRNCRRGRQHICENTVGIGVTRNGSFAEYVVVPATNVMRMHPSIPDEMLAIMDPFGNATHTALSWSLIGEDVLVTGAGLIGSMCVAVAKFAGARYVVATETNDFRIELAKKMGATRVVNPLKEKLSDVVKELGMKGFDIGLECSGSPIAFNDMLENMYNSGKISLLGILPPKTGINWDKVIFKGLTLKGIYGREMYETWYQMEQMLHSGLDLSPIITHRFHINDFEKGFKIMDEGNCGKVILNWE